MADNGIVRQRRPAQKVRTTIPDVSAPPLPDLVERDFSRRASPASAPAGTSPTSQPAKAGCTWPTCSTSARGASSATPWTSACRTELVAAALDDGGRRSGAATSPAWSSTTTAGLNICRRDFRALCDQARHRPVGRTHRVVPRQRRGRVVLGELKRELVTAAASPRGPRPVGRSSPGSTTTTPCGCTPRSATSRRSSGSYATSAVDFKPHNHVSG